MDDILKCYQILDLAPGVPAEMVRRSYIELTQVWDPAKYQSNPVLYSRAEQKRNEIDEAYRTIRAFLPELQNPEYKADHDPRPPRDFTELSTELPGQSSHALLGVIIGIVLFLLFVWAIYVVMKGSHVNLAAPALE